MCCAVFWNDFEFNELEFFVWAVKRICFIRETGVVLLMAVRYRLALDPGLGGRCFKKLTVTMTIV